MAENNVIKRVWDAFRNKDPAQSPSIDYGPTTTQVSNNSQMTYNRSYEQTIVNTIFTRIAVDASMIKFRHIRVDSNDSFIGTVDRKDLNYIFKTEANIDQPTKAFFRDVVLTMFQSGVACLVPVQTSVNPEFTDSYTIEELRVGNVVQFYPEYVRVSVYNSKRARKEEILMRKRDVAIVENPFSQIMNNNNSTLKRLVRAMCNLDKNNDNLTADKINMLVQLPYAVKSENRRTEAADRIKNLEKQLKESKYGIGYIDATEKITPIGGNIQNNFWEQAKELKDELISEMGLTKGILDGTASEQELVNYHNRTIKPIVTVICDEMERKFLSKTARSQNQAIRCYQNPFELMTLTNLSQVADVFARNEVLTSNEIRGEIGYAPNTEDPTANQLINSNNVSYQTTMDPYNQGGDPNAQNEGVEERDLVDGFLELKEIDPSEFDEYKQNFEVFMNEQNQQ